MLGSCGFKPFGPWDEGYSRDSSSESNEAGKKQLSLGQGCLVVLGLIVTAGIQSLFLPDAIFKEPVPRTDREIKYKIESEDRLPPYKASVVVRLEEKISREDIQKIAPKNQNDGCRNYDRVYIGYLLPGMVDGEGAWATSHFDPDLEIRLVGFLS